MCSKLHDPELRSLTCRGRLLAHFRKRRISKQKVCLSEKFRRKRERARLPPMTPERTRAVRVTDRSQPLREGRRHERGCKPR